VASDSWGTFFGIVLVIGGTVLLAVTFFTAYGIARDPSAFIVSQASHFNTTSSGPAASFTWTTQGYNATFRDTSSDNGSTIRSWVWGFGDGTTYSGETPPVHAYAVTCAQCTENVTLTITDQAGRQSIASASVQVQRTGTDGGVGVSSSSLLSSLDLGGFLSTLAGPFESIFLLFLGLLIMFLVGGALTRAGWNLLRPRPETIQLRVKPKSLLREWEFVPPVVSSGAPPGPNPPGPPRS